ncbi:VOC family protein [Flavobacterium urocaniciphilum]|uniref:Glyoxalase-like domain-containing protein n=1 Tax=Flavobacterium urocaniciphilum TaxID=1299341 RepID=A0A1H9B031_9FLAO|nr:VOC family protein [Flavobacterium urocaniciphilum]SEP82229.1 Glyoxalase-like domain-containing protein [Flavobacterium urocaniciphilum]
MQINHLEFILYVSNQEKSKAFYELMFQQAPTLHVPGMTEFTLNEFTKIGLMPNDGIAKIVSPTLPHPENGNGIPRCELYLTIENLEEQFPRLLNAGATLINPISPRDWGDTVGYLADFDGHVIALASKK